MAPIEWGHHPNDLQDDKQGILTGALGDGSMHSV